jgi:hypothetical protein
MEIMLTVILFAGAVGFASTAAHASEAEDRQTLADLDTKYQKAVEQNDARTMAKILADDFVLVEGDGKRSTKADLVNDAKSGKTHYVHQDDSERTVAEVRRGSIRDGPLRMDRRPAVPGHLATFDMPKCPQ